MRGRTSVVGLALALFLAAAFLVAVPAPEARSDDDTSVGADDCERGTFRSYRDQPAREIVDPVPGLFQLSQDYPDSPGPENQPWLDADVSALDTDEGALAYLELMKSHALDGNLEVDFVVQNNPNGAWYHVPWLDASTAGRERLHGLTNELNAPPGTLAPKSELDRLTQNWAVGAYNRPGGWAIGQVWCDPDNPDLNALNPGDGANSFPNGTAVFKLLFTTATPEELDYLDGTFEWTANIYPQALTIEQQDPDSANPTGPVPDRTHKSVYLIQMDLAVRDDRLPLGWAFGSYAYFNDSPGDGAESGDGHEFDRLIPIGLQWSDAPGVTPAMVPPSSSLENPWTPPGTWINRGYARHARHLGWANRLVGPLDNPASSCMSCHSSSGSPGAPIVPEAASWFDLEPGELAPVRERLAWFSDTPAGVPFSPTQRTSADYSLQLSIGLQRFYADTCATNVVDELYSARGPERRSPFERATSSGTCDALAPTVVAASGAGTPVWLAVALVAAGLGLGVLLTAWWQRRNDDHELAATG